MDDVTKTGFDLEMEEKVEEEAAVTYKPRPFCTWEVNGTEYKLKLTTQVITKLENQFGTSLMDAVLEKGMPELWVIVAILQGAMLKFNHSIKSDQVANLLDAYIEGGKTQMDLLSDVLYPLMYDAGFFTEALLKELQKELKQIDSEL